MVWTMVCPNTFPWCFFAIFCYFCCMFDSLLIWRIKEGFVLHKKQIYRIQTFIFLIMYGMRPLNDTHKNGCLCTQWRYRNSAMHIQCASGRKSSSLLRFPQGRGMGEQWKGFGASKRKPTWSCFSQTQWTWVFRKCENFAIYHVLLYTFNICNDSYLHVFVSFFCTFHPTGPLHGDRLWFKVVPNSWKHNWCQWKKLLEWQIRNCKSFLDETWDFRDRGEYVIYVYWCILMYALSTFICMFCCLCLRCFFFCFQVFSIISWVFGTGFHSGLDEMVDIPNTSHRYLETCYPWKWWHWMLDILQAWCWKDPVVFLWKISLPAFAWGSARNWVN